MAKNTATEEMRVVSRQIDESYRRLESVIDRMWTFVDTHCPKVETWVALPPLGTDESTTFLGFSRRRPGNDWTLLLWRCHEQMDGPQIPLSQGSTDDRVIAVQHFGALVENILGKARSKLDALKSAVVAGEKQLQDAQENVVRWCPPPRGWMG